MNRLLTTIFAGALSLAALAQTDAVQSARPDFVDAVISMTKSGRADCTASVWAKAANESAPAKMVVRSLFMVCLYTC